MIPSESNMIPSESNRVPSEKIMNRYSSVMKATDSNMNPSILIDATVIPMETSINHDVLFHYIRYSFYHYVPNKPNKKKMKQWIESIPYFLPEMHQNVFFKLIRTYPIESYWDTREKMEEYGYLLYSTFHKTLRKSYKTKEDYQLDLYQNKKKHKQIHNMIYFIIVFLFIVILYKWIL
jgi:hypothetical protein